MASDIPGIAFESSGCKSETNLLEDDLVRKVSALDLVSDSDDSDSDNHSDSDDSDISSNDESESKYCRRGPEAKTLEARIPNDFAKHVEDDYLVRQIGDFPEKMEEESITDISGYGSSPSPSTSGSFESSSMPSIRSSKVKRRKEIKKEKGKVMKDLKGHNFSPAVGVMLRKKEIRSVDPSCIMNLYAMYPNDEEEFYYYFSYLVHTMKKENCLPRIKYITENQNVGSLAILFCQKRWNKSLGLLLIMLPSVNLLVSGKEISPTSEVTYMGTALHHAVRQATDICVKEICLYLKKCGNPLEITNAVDTYSHTPLSLALVYYNHENKEVFEKIIQYLLWVTDPFKPYNYVDFVRNFLPRQEKEILTVLYDMLKRSINCRYDLEMAAVENIRQILDSHL